MVAIQQMLYIRMTEYLRSLRDDEEGQGLVEYALILTLVSIGVITALGLLTGALNGVFNKVTTTLGGVVPS